MVNSKEARSYTITLRTRIGILDSLTTKVLSWCKAQDYALMALEGEGDESHLHIQSWHNEPLLRNTINRAFDRFLSKCYKPEDYIISLAKKIKPAHNDWYDHYLVNNVEKGEPTLLFNAPPPNSEEFYPSEAEQLKIAERCNAVDTYMYNLYCLWKEECGDCEPTVCNVAQFLASIMFNKTAKVRVIKDKRKRCDLSCALRAYIRGSEGTLNAMDKMYLFMSNKDWDRLVYEPWKADLKEQSDSEGLYEDVAMSVSDEDQGESD